MRKAFPIALIVIGVIFAAAGGYTMFRGFDAKDQVKTELKAQAISIPNRVDPATKKVDEAVPAAWSGKAVNSAASAQAMANVINHHALASSGGKTYSTIGKYLAKDGKTDTNDATAALVGSDGKPVANPTRNTLLTASNLQTSLYTSVMAFNLADLVIGLGLMIVTLGLAVGGLGIALAGLAIPSFARKLHVEPAAVPHTA